jgi:hypothetical protein
MPEDPRVSNRERMLQRSRLLMMVVLSELNLLVRVLKESQAGFPSGADAGNGDWDDRTQAAAMIADRARKDFGQLDWLIADIDKKCNELDSIRTYWTITVKNLLTGTQEKGCRSCARIKVDIGGKKVDKWSPRQQLPNDPEQVDEDGKPIPQYSPLCQWCGDWSRAEGEYPPLPVLQAHHEGRRITSGLLKRLGVETKMSARDRRKKAS